MYSLISLPLVPEVLAEYPGEGISDLCRSHGCQGVEGVWGGADLPLEIARELRIGYHLTFYPDWLDFWRGDRSALERKFGSMESWRSFYGGKEGRETLLRLYREDLERALLWGAKYVVFHVSDVSIEEGYTYQWEHKNEEIIDAAAEALNLLLGERNFDFALLLENQWWPGFTFTEPALTARLLDAVAYPNKGIMLDIGHLMNTNLSISTQAEGADYLHEVLDVHGSLCTYIRGIHLHQSVSGAYVKANTGKLPGDLPADYLERFAYSYRHILRIDTHRPWTHPSIRSVVERIRPEYLIHELSAAGRQEREQASSLQRRTLGWT